MKTAKIYIKKSGKFWRLSLVAGNGKKLNDPYTSKGNAKRAAIAIKKQINDAVIIES